MKQKKIRSTKTINKKIKSTKKKKKKLKNEKRIKTTEAIKNKK